MQQGLMSHKKYALYTNGGTQYQLKPFLSKYTETVLDIQDTKIPEIVLTEESTVSLSKTPEVLNIDDESTYLITCDIYHSQDSDIITKVFNSKLMIDRKLEIFEKDSKINIVIQIIGNNSLSISTYSLQYPRLVIKSIKKLKRPTIATKKLKENKSIIQQAQISIDLISAEECDKATTQTGKTQYDLTYKEYNMYFRDSDNDTLQYSYDNKTWEDSNLSGITAYPKYRNKLWLVGKSDGIYYSYNGKTWTKGSRNEGVRFILFFDNTWFICGGTSVSKSTNGINWTSCTINSPYIYSSIYAAYHGNHSILISGAYLSGNKSTIFLCKDKQTFNPVYPNGDSSHLSAGIFIRGHWLAFGLNYYNDYGCYYSLDGETWTETGTSGWYTEILGGKLKYKNNTLFWGSYYSTDGGITWAQLDMDIGDINIFAEDLYICSRFYLDESDTEISLLISADIKNWYMFTFDLSKYFDFLPVDYFNPRIYIESYDLNTNNNLIVYLSVYDPELKSDRYIKCTFKTDLLNTILYTYYSNTTEEPLLYY